ncbi:MAG: thioredoxin domain-containing protein, partial [Armatimonadetes bacterium]|nr:thioredoxin domain-containing protein [Armatimonadota bacterium]
ARRFGDQACFSYRNFPLEKHKFGLNSAFAAEAAANQGKFWEMKELIFDRQEQMDAMDFDERTFVKWAQELGMNPTVFTNDYSSKEVHDRVTVDTKAGLALDLQTTPTFFVVTADGIWRFEGMGTLAPALQNPNHGIHQSKSPVLPPEMRKN